MEVLGTEEFYAEKMHYMLHMFDEYINKIIY